jgi:hypothetical protein
VNLTYIIVNKLGADIFTQMEFLAEKGGDFAKRKDKIHGESAPRE